MSMLARYKKKGGIIELVKLIEDSPEPKRTQLLEMVKKEDAAFAAEVEARILTFEVLRAQPEAVVAEIISATAPKFVAMATFGDESEFKKLVERCLGKNFQEYKMEKEILESKPPTPGQIEAAQRKVVSEARKLEENGQIRFASLQSGDPASLSASSAKPAATPGAATATAATPAGASTPATSAEGAAKAEDGCPPLASFKLEPPVPGLHGERFENFLKTLLK